MKPRLYIFAGKPGAGKTTIIAHLFPNQPFVDVLPFVEQFRTGVTVPEEKTELAYHNMYRSLKTAKDQTMILEIGTNHPELNISEITKLQDMYDIMLFLCEASREICHQRATLRGMRHTTEAWEARMKRDFPNTFIKLLSTTTIPYYVVDMGKSLKETVEVFKKLIS